MEAKDVTFQFVEEDESVLITKDVEIKLKYLLEKYEQLEWMAALLGDKRKDGTWVVKDLYIMEQEVTGGHVEPTVDGNKEVANLKDCFGWIHSHNTMNAFFSATDWETAQMYSVSLCVNNDFNFYGSCLKEVDCPQSNAHGKKVMKKITVYLESFILPEKEKEKLDKVCEEKISERQFSSDVKTVQSYLPEPDSGCYDKYDVYKREHGNGVDDWDFNEDDDEVDLKLLDKQPFLSNYFDDVGEVTGLGQAELATYAVSMKKKIVREFGNYWECPLCDQVLGRKNKKICYSPDNDRYVHYKCLQNRFGVKH